MFVPNMLDNIMQQYDIKFFIFNHWRSACEEIAAYKGSSQMIIVEIMLCLLNTGWAHVNPYYLASHLSKWKQVTAFPASNLQYSAFRSYLMVLLDIGHVIIG